MRGRYTSLEPFVLWRQLQRPCPWQELFPQSAPLTLEVGFGNGEYLCRQAATHPERNYVGLELHWESIRRTLRRLARDELTNVRIVQVDAQMALERLFPPQSLAHFCALFPCPWPKHQHAHHRLFTARFMSLVNSRLEDGASGLIVTDHAGLRDHISHHLPGCGFEWELQTQPPRFNTKYERRWTGEGQTEFFEFHLRKTTHIPIPVPEEVALVTHHVPEFKPESFRPEPARGEVTVEFKRFLWDPQQEIAMVMVLAAEPSITQTFWVEIHRHPKGWAISPAPGCGVVLTQSVQRALEIVRDAAA